MSMSTAMALSFVERTNDQGREYYDGIVKFLNSEECHSMKLSDL